MARDRVVALLLTGERRVIVTGLPGTGKTTLLRDAARILSSAGWDVSLQLHIGVRPAVFAGTSGAPAALLVDEADRLGTVELSLLCGGTRQALLLAGLDGLAARFRESPHVALTPFPPEEAQAFIHLWLAQAGHAPGRFHQDAVDQVAGLSGGVPRLITILLSAALWTADFAGEGQVRKTHVDQAAALRNSVLAPGEPETDPTLTDDDAPAVADVVSAPDAIPDADAPPGPPAEIDPAPPVPEPPIVAPTQEYGRFPAAPVPIAAPASPAAARPRRRLVPLLAVAGVIITGGAAILVWHSPWRDLNAPRPGAPVPALPGAPSSPAARPADPVSQNGPAAGRILPKLEPAVIVPAALIEPPAPVVPRAAPAPVPEPAPPATAVAAPTPMTAVPAMPPAEAALISDLRLAEIPPAPQPPAGPVPGMPIQQAGPPPIVPMMEFPAAQLVAAAQPQAPPSPSQPFTAAPPPPEPPMAQPAAPEPLAETPPLPLVALPPAIAGPPDAPADPLPPDPLPLTTLQPPAPPTAQPPPPSPPPPPPGPAAVPPPAPPPMPPEVMALLLRRGSEMLAAGDVSAARLLFGRAASAGNSNAMIALGLTFDPVALARSRSSVPPDREAASLWFRRGLQAGHPDAAALLQRLARLPGK